MLLCAKSAESYWRFSSCSHEKTKETEDNNSNLESNFQNSPGPQFQEASDIVYHHFDDPSQVILNAPVNDYLQEHNSKYYHYAVGGKATQSSSHKVIKEKEDMEEAPVRTYDFVIGDDSTTNRPDFKLRQPPPPITKTIQ